MAQVYQGLQQDNVRLEDQKGQSEPRPEPNRDAVEWQEEGRSHQTS